MTLDPQLLKQLLDTFKTELDEQLDVIINGLLLLEKEDTNQPKENTIKSIFRAAHNIKGTARSLEIYNVSEIAHHIESLFALIQKNEVKVSRDMIDLCLEAVDKMRLAMLAFLEKKELSFNIEEYLNRLAAITKIKVSTEAIATPTEAHPSIPTEPAIKIEETEAPAVEVRAKDTIRVSIKNVEHISAMMEDMQINKIGIDEHYRQVTHINDRLNDFAKAWHHLTAYAKTNTLQQGDGLLKTYHTAADLFTEIKSDLLNLQKSMHHRINELSILTDALQDEIRTLRLVPASLLFANVPRYVRDLSKGLNKQVEVDIQGDEVRMDKLILESLKDPIIHLLRNAIDHGIEESAIRQKNNKSMVGHIQIKIQEESGMISITITDDGMGIDPERVKATAVRKKLATQAELDNMAPAEILDFLFQPGFSTKEIITDISGRGVGLDVVKTNITNIKGSISLQSEINQGTSFKLLVPLTLTSERGLLVQCCNQCFVIPTSSVVRVLTISLDDIISVEGKQAILLDQHAVVLHTLADILKLEQQELPKANIDVVVIKKGRELNAIVVDEIVGEREIVIKSLHPPINKIPSVAGGTLSGTNQVIIVLDANDLAAITGRISQERRMSTHTEKNTKSNKPHILVVDDSITTRTLEKNILESHNYQVTVAVNGKEAWELLQKQQFSLMITDVTMPIMDGFALTEKVKTSEKLRDLPVIIVTSLGSDSEKKRGIDAGANAYLIKNEFESSALLEVVAQLV